MRSGEALPPAPAPAGARRMTSARALPLTQNAAPSGSKALASRKYAAAGGTPPSGIRARRSSPVTIRSLTSVRSTGSTRSGPDRAWSLGKNAVWNGVSTILAVNRPPPTIAASGARGRRQRRGQKQEQRIEAHEVAVADRTARPGIRVGHVEQQPRRRTECRGADDPLPPPPFARPREEEQDAQHAREEVRQRGRCSGRSRSRRGCAGRPAAHGSWR